MTNLSDYYNLDHELWYPDQDLTQNVTDFLSHSNILALTKRIYLVHVRDGGKIKYEVFKTQISKMMNSWKRLHLFSIDEVRYINEQFMKDYRNVYYVGNDYKTLTRTNTMMAEDYGLLDSMEPQDVFVELGETSRSRQRNLSTFRRVSYRNHDRKDGGKPGRSLKSRDNGFSMNSYIDYVDKPLENADSYVVPYYTGAIEDDDNFQ